ncbi:MAG: PilZ domain-containing protein [Chloroflexi bacterium]|nr:PilZ domain-containing protein [Chloroflexota bacterium]
MPEKRKVPRKKFSTYMRVLDDDTEKTVGHLVDVGLRGLQLEVAAPIPMGQEYHMHMELTPDVSDKLFMFLAARSKWIRPDEIMPNLYRVGFEIVHMEPHDYEIYQRLVEIYGE